MYRIGSRDYTCFIVTSRRPRKAPPASLSLDLDNLWSYLKIHGDPAGSRSPAFSTWSVPRILDFLAARRLRITFFVVGQDAAREESRGHLAAIAAAGHEIANHSFQHESWLHLYSEAELEEELGRAEEAIERATGRRTAGFRGPGLSLSAATLAVLARRGYRYDASTLPTFVGPLARAYYFRTAGLTAEQKRVRRACSAGSTRASGRYGPTAGGWERTGCSRSRSPRCRFCAPPST